MFTRTDKDGLVVDNEDCDFIWKHRKELPKELQPYYLVTKRRRPGIPRDVSYFRHYPMHGGWYKHWGSLDSQWDGSNLVLRRCT
jgi:hypothetical protein